MEKASDELDFEKATIMRDKIKSLNIIQSSLTVTEANLIEADVIAIYKESGKTCIQVFFYRSKQNWGNQAFFQNMMRKIQSKIFSHLSYLSFMKIKLYQV